MIPKNQDSGFTDVRIAFTEGKLRLLEMKDNFGQTTQMSFSDVEENVDISEDKFKFIPPPGVDVLEEGG